MSDHDTIRELASTYLTHETRARAEKALRLGKIGNAKRLIISGITNHWGAGKISDQEAQELHERLGRATGTKTTLTEHHG